LLQLGQHRSLDHHPGSGPCHDDIRALIHLSLRAVGGGKFQVRNLHQDWHNCNSKAQGMDLI
jgi:hypothetical protein